MKVCTACKVKKAGRHFTRNADGSMGAVCKRCAGLAEGEKVRAANTDAEPAAEEVIAEFELAAGWPVVVKAQPGMLVLTQDRPDEEDGKTYRYEVRMLPSQARQFLDRCAEMLEKAAA